MIGRAITTFYVCLPLFFALSVADDFDVSTARLFAIGLFAVFLCSGFFAKKICVPVGVVSFLAAVFILLCLVSLLYSDVPGWTIRKIVYFISLAPLFVVTASALVSGKLDEIRLVKAVVIGCLLAATVMVVQFFAQFFIGHQVIESLWSKLTPFFLGGTFSQSVATYNSWFVHVGGQDLFRAIGFFPDPHVAAFYTGMILPFAVGLAAQTKKNVWYACAILILIANLATLSRGGEVGLIGGAVVALALFWKQISLPFRHGILAVCAVAALVAVIPGNSFTQRLMSSFDGSDTSNTARVEIWSEALAIWAESPMIGTGLGAFSYAVDPSADYRTPIYAHNLLLDILVEFGLVGFCVVLALIIWMIFIFWRQGSAISHSAIISLSILLIHGIFDTPIFSIHVFAVILFLMSLASYYEHKFFKKKVQ